MFIYIMSNYRSDPFWFENINILFTLNRIGEFFPAPDMTIDEKLNAIVRFTFYFAFVMIVLYKSLNYLGMPMLAMLLSYFLYVGRKNKKNTIEEEFYSSDNCVQPTEHNPYMNYMVGDKTDKKGACLTYKNTELKEKVTDIVNKDLYMSTDDVWQRKNSERQFYTMPNTRSMNDQKAFAEWCFGQPKTCKEGNGVQCAANNYNNAPVTKSLLSH